MIRTRVFVTFPLFLVIYCSQRGNHIRNATEHPLNMDAIKYTCKREYSISVIQVDVQSPIYLRVSLAGGYNVKVFVVRELLISWPHEGLERNPLIGLNVLNKAL